MIYALFSPILVSALIGLVVGRQFRRKQHAIALRLARGRAKLLDEEIAAQEKHLDNFDFFHLKAISRQATKAVDELAGALARRQTYMQTCEDLAHLQQYKLELLDAHPPSALQPLATGAKVNFRASPADPGTRSAFASRAPQPTQNQALLADPPKGKKKSDPPQNGSLFF